MAFVPDTNSPKDLTEELLAAYEARLTFVKRIVGDTRKMLDEFRGRREKMSTELRELLAKSESLRKKDFDQMMAGILAVQGQREENVKTMLEGFKQEEERVAEKLRHLIQKGEGVKIKDLKRVLTKIKEEQQEREKSTGIYVNEEMSKMQQEVAGMLGEFKKEREKMTTEWERVAATVGQSTEEKRPSIIEKSPVQ